MLRAFAVVTLAAGCAHSKPVEPLPEARPLVPEPVTLTVKAGREHDTLVAETERHVRERLEQHQHPVVGEAHLALEIEIVSVGGLIRDGSYLYCVKLGGRVIRDGQRFSAVETATERCELERYAHGGVNDPGGAALALAISMVEALTTTHGPLDTKSALYVGALDELTDTLGRQACRRD